MLAGNFIYYQVKIAFLLFITLYLHRRGNNQPDVFERPKNRTCVARFKKKKKKKKRAD